MVRDATMCASQFWIFHLYVYFSFTTIVFVFSSPLCRWSKGQKESIRKYLIANENERNCYKVLWSYLELLDFKTFKYKGHQVSCQGYL